MKSRRLLAPILTILVSLLLILLPGRLQWPGAEPVVVTGLEGPRGLTPTSGGDLLIAELAGGRVLRMNQRGNLSVLLEGLPYTLGGPGGQYPTGVSSAVIVDGQIYFVIGEFRGQGYSTLNRAEPGGVPEVIAGGFGRDGFPRTHLTNPYDLLPAPQGGFLVSDSGFNAVLHVTMDGIVKDYALFPDLTVPTDDGSGERPVDVVPTGLAFGPDGAVYVASLTGSPYPAGRAAVYRLEDSNRDGDALDEGETTQWVSGLTTATDLAFLADGSLLISEFSSDLQALEGDFDLARAARYPGRIVRWQGGALEEVRSGLAAPTALAVVRGRIFVSEEFAGRVRELRP